MEIEKGIPIPSRPSLVRLLRQMEVGDSILSCFTPDSTRALANKVAKETGWKFTCRKMQQDGLRIWRVS